MTSVYANDTDLITFLAPYHGKNLLLDAMDRDRTAWSQLKNLSIIKSAGNFLLARIECIAAASFVALSAVIITVAAGLALPLVGLYAVVVIPLSYIFSCEQEAAWARKEFGALLQVSMIGLSVLGLFVVAAGTQCVLPGIHKADGVFFSSIDSLTGRLGPMKTFYAKVDAKIFRGTQSKLTIGEGLKEYVRALSSRQARTIECQSVTYRFTYTVKG